MNAIEYARRNVFLWQSSPVSGQWDDRKYPFVRGPLMALDDVHCKCLVLYGPTQSFKTVCLQVATAYRLDMKRKSLMAVAQTDDDAAKFYTVKLSPFLSRIKSLDETVLEGVANRKIGLWRWPTHEMIVTGPGVNAQQSDSVCYLHTDESHVWSAASPGAMASLDNRMGGRWDRAAFHVTTAADAGTEIDIVYHKGQQNEWHQSCIHCQKLIWPLWIEASRKEYNGHEVFQWRETQSEQETLDSIRMVCPHCDREIEDTAPNRRDLDEGAQYVRKNADSDRAFNSFRWNAFAPRWKAYRDLLAIYLKALQSAKLGDVAPYVDWVTKQEVRSNTGEFPMLGDSTRGRNYSLGEIPTECVENRLRTCSIDQQEGKGGEGFHLWVQIDEWEQNGNSRRLFYGKCFTYQDARAKQLEYKVKDGQTAIDYGQGMREREIFAICEKYRWIAMKSTDEEYFSHEIRRVGGASEWVKLPYSDTELQSASVGRVDMKKIRIRGKVAPQGFAISRLWSKPKVYAIMYRLKSGMTDREYGVARDMSADYVRQLHSYVPSEPVDKATRVSKAPIWRKVATDDHAFVTSCQSLILAIVAGFFQLGAIPKVENAAIDSQR